MWIMSLYGLATRWHWIEFHVDGTQEIPATAGTVEERQ